MIERIKKVLDIEDNLQDDVLDILISNIESHIKSMIEKDEVPEALNYIVEELTVRRFNRIGSEGMKSETVEGHTVTYYELDDDFKPYENIILSHKEPPTRKGRGKVIMI